MIKCEITLNFYLKFQLNIVVIDHHYLNFEVIYHNISTNYPISAIKFTSKVSISAFNFLIVDSVSIIVRFSLFLFIINLRFSLTSSKDLIYSSIFFFFSSFFLSSSFFFSTSFNVICFWILTSDATR